MKKQNIIFSVLFLTFAAMPTYTFALTASGTVVDATGDPIIGASVQVMDSEGNILKDAENHQKGTTTDLEGNFKLESLSATDQLQVSYIGYKTQVVKTQEGLKIKLEEDDGESLKNVNIMGCNSDALRQPLNAKKAESFYLPSEEKSICIATECIGDPGEYELQETYLNDDDPNPKKHTCTETSKFEENGDERKTCMATCVKVKCNKAEIKALEHAADGEYKNGKCVPTDCEDGYHLNDNKCEKNECPTPEEDWDGTKCVKTRCTPDEAKAVNAKYGKWENNRCIPKDCEDEINFKLENGSCVANDCPAKELEKINAISGTMKDGKCIIGTCKDGYTPENGTCINKDILAKKQKAYEDAKATEQSDANKALTAATTAATGIGGMQALQGMAEQSADEDAMADMAAYIETMRCTYADGKQVKAGPEEIELPGANDQELMNLRGQYLALAQDLKERKEALGMKPGIESETIMDRTQTELYDDENIGITNGNYESIYRAMMLSSEKDQAKIDDAAKTSANRVKYGAIAAGAGVVVGIAGNSLINGKLGELLKSKKADNKEEVPLLEQETKALEDLKKCLSDAGIKDSSDWGFKNFYPSVLSVKNINCKTLKLKSKPTNASEMFADSNDENVIFNTMNKYFDMATISKMVGFTKEESVDNIKAKIKSSMSEKQKNIDEAQKKDAESGASSDGLGNLLGNVDISSIAGGAR